MREEGNESALQFEVHFDSDSLSFYVGFTYIWPRSREPLRVKQSLKNA